MSEGRGKVIRVRAMKRGFYGLTPDTCKLLEEGEEFDCYERDFSDAHRDGTEHATKGKRLKGWMEKVEAGVAPKPAASGEDKKGKKLPASASASVI